MILDIVTLMISSWEVNKFCLELREFMTLKFFKKGRNNVVLTQQPLKIILNALNMELIPTVEEELDFKELSCYFVDLRTLETVHYSHVILRE